MSWPSIDHYNRQTWCLSMCFSKTDFLVKVFPHSSHLFKRCIKYKSRQTQIWRSTWAQDNHKVLFNIKTCNLRFSGCLGTVFQECFDSSCNEVGRGGVTKSHLLFIRLLKLQWMTKKLKCVLPGQWGQRERRQREPGNRTLTWTRCCRSGRKTLALVWPDLQKKNDFNSK